MYLFIHARIKVQTMLVKVAPEINSSGAETRIFQDKKIKTMLADILPPCDVALEQP